MTISRENRFPFCQSYHCAADQELGSYSQFHIRLTDGARIILNPHFFLFVEVIMLQIARGEKRNGTMKGPFSHPGS
ncbi:MAG: hypothetical protein HXS53_12260 [Theionarchaea archaeon]|nr:hypothetical protein [Theionarchaea archaeon]